MTLLRLLQRSAEKFSDETVLLAGDRSMSYGELWHSVVRLGVALRDLGVEGGERVGVMLPNVPAFIQAYFGILAAGGTVVPFNTLYKPEEVRCLLEDAGIRRVLTGRIFLPGLQEAADRLSRPVHAIPLDTESGSLESGTPDAVSVGRPTRGSTAIYPDDVAVCLYTSGTTGRPKGALLTHTNLLSNIESFQQIVPCDKRDRFLCVLPLFHSFAATVLMLFPVSLGAAIVLEPRFVPEQTLRNMAKQRVTVFAAVPSMYAVWGQLSSLDVDLSSVRFAVSGGAPLPVEVLQRFEARYGIPIYEGYGLTEASPVLTENPPLGARKVGSVGKPLPGVELRVVDAAGKEVGTGDVGEIVAKGPNIMQGYLNWPEASAEVLRDGWLYSGDLGRRDADGYFYIVDRKKDLIIVGGLNVYPREVEEMLAAHPAVADVAVVGVPDPTRGESPKAYVVLKPGHPASKGELLRFARERLAAFKIPREVEFCQSMPRTISGKVLRQHLGSSTEV
ncbi:MAG: long-chain fatty acid--CoA ligase [Candidatus Methylomirabilales bacterium]